MKYKQGENDHNQYSIKIARSVEEVEELRSIWEGWQWHPNADIDFYLTIVNARPEILRPHTILVSINGNPKAMMVGRIEDQRLDIKIGYKKIFRPKLRILRIVYGGILGEQSDVTAHIFVSELIEELKKREIGAVVLDNLKVNSVMYQLAKTKPGIFCRDHSRIANPHWKMFLTPTYDELLKQMWSNLKYQLKRLERYGRVLNKDFQGKVEFKIRKNVDEIDTISMNAEQIMEKTYQRGIGVGFFDNAENRRRLSLEAEKKWLRTYELCINGRTVAFWIGSKYGNVFHLNFTGYDPDYKKYDPGMVLFLKMIEDCCKNEIREIDFGFGDAFYKQRFGDQKWEEASVTLFAPTFKGVGINLGRLLVNVVSNLAELILRKAKLLGKIKKTWRNHLSQSIKDDNANP
jgi:hypothetical protein